MRISPIDMTKPIEMTKSIGSITDIAPSGAKAAGTESADPIGSFGETMKKAVGEVNSLQNQADQAAVRLAAGDVEDVHKAMIAMQKAKLALDFTIQVRNKVIDAYQEIMRMQV